MPNDITIQMIPKKSVKLTRFKHSLKGNMRKGLSQIGRVLAKQAKRNISGLGFTRNKNRSSKYFGINSGDTFSALKYRMESSGKAVVIGSNTSYVKDVIPARFGGEYTGSKITGHFLVDTLKQQSKAIEEIFAGKIWKPLK